jgi:hypothetical protein
MNEYFTALAQQYAVVANMLKPYLAQLEAAALRN